MRLTFVENWPTVWWSVLDWSTSHVRYGQLDSIAVSSFDPGIIQAMRSSKENFDTDWPKKWIVSLGWSLSVGHLKMVSQWVTWHRSAFPGPWNVLMTFIWNV